MLTFLFTDSKITSVHSRHMVISTHIILSTSSKLFPIIPSTTIQASAITFFPCSCLPILQFFIAWTISFLSTGVCLSSFVSLTTPFTSSILSYTVNHETLFQNDLQVYSSYCFSDLVEFIIFAPTKYSSQFLKTSVLFPFIIFLVYFNIAHIVIFLHSFLAF